MGEPEDVLDEAMGDLAVAYADREAAVRQGQVTVYRE
jgi:hypothetical protein